MALKIDNIEDLPFYYRVVSIVLFVFSFYLFYQFVRPDISAEGELMKTLRYTAFGASAVTCIMTLFRHGFIYRMLTLLLFVASFGGIWLYQSGGEAYALYDEVRAKTQAKTAEQPADYAAVPHKIVELMHSYADLESEPEYYASDLNDISAERNTPAAQASAEKALPKGDKAARAEERVSPAQIRETFINSIVKLNTAANQEVVEQYIWIFALKGPYEKVKYTWSEDNIPLLILYVLAVYAIAGFIVDVFAAGEDRWNLI